MRFLRTHLHGAFDYVCGFALILVPHLIGFFQTPSADILPAGHWVLQLVGMFILVQSLMTHYECGVLRVLTMSTHLFNERIIGLFLALSPWVFDFHVAGDASWLPHCAMGALLILGSIITRDKPERVLESAF